MFFIFCHSKSSTLRNDAIIINFSVLTPPAQHVLVSDRGGVLISTLVNRRTIIARETTNSNQYQNQEEGVP